MNLNAIGPYSKTPKNLTKRNGQNYTTADMNSAYNQMPLDKQSRRLTHFAIGNQEYEFNRIILPWDQQLFQPL